MPEKVVFLLVLALTTCLHQHHVAAAGNCTKQQRDAIIDFCGVYILKRHPGGAPTVQSMCCRKVRDVKDRDMDCIVDLLPIAVQIRCGKRIRDLKLLCAVYSHLPAHNHQVT
ncbi:hypothetical protein HU200_016734 [Digitaria exilis]|uniref:Bifunctional inhibitor/plant lipid transfer protein/seed storage helical domain-containing protein n=1 Tax=Digitaria exilis TaxID=1010633 RepID=A0A835F830_9POAL|nr:hypothetical protein HU200_016734 [Digitaria exilis]